MVLARAPSLATYCSNLSVRGIKGATYAGYSLSCPCWCSLYSPPQLPLSADWTATGRLTPVKGSSISAFESAYFEDYIHYNSYSFQFKYPLPNGCGWLLTAVSAVEAALSITYPNLRPAILSSQIIADCANQGNGFRDQGCLGGRAVDALQFMSPLCRLQRYTRTLP